MSKKVYIFLADGFEDIEGLTVVDLLRRAGIDIKTVSIKETTRIQTSHGITMLTDAIFAETDFADADMLVLPGGMPGTKYLAGYKPLIDLLTDFNNKGKKIAAICAAPSVFSGLGFLKGRKATSYPSESPPDYGFPSSSATTFPYPCTVPDTPAQNRQTQNSWQQLSKSPGEQQQVPVLTV